MAIEVRGASVLAWLVLLFGATPQEAAHSKDLSARAACVCVKGPEITAADAASALNSRGVGWWHAPRNPDMAIAHAPLPGTTRVLKVDVAARLAGLSLVGAVDRPGESTGGETVCFVREMVGINASEVLESMRAAFPAHSLQIELISYAPVLAPSGVVEFRPDGLGISPSGLKSGGQVWRGRIRQGRQAFPIRARVRVSEVKEALVAVRDLAGGEPVTSENVALRRAPQLPNTPSGPLSLADLGGMALRRPVAAGGRIDSSNLQPRLLVRPNEQIEVEARTGTVVLAWKAKARGFARSGERLMVDGWNSGDQRAGRGSALRVRVTGPGKAIADID